MFEGVFDVREQAGLVQEFGGLQALQRFAQMFGSEISDRLQHAAGHLIANHGGGLKQALVDRGQAVDA